MLLVNLGAVMMPQLGETAQQHEIVLCVVTLQFVEFYVPWEIPVAQMQTALGR